MRCSYSEPLLDGYVDGILTPLQRRRVAMHLRTCEHCSGLLEELRVIDALLLAPRKLEPAPNFTFKVMAEVRCERRPHAHLHGPAPLPVLAAYLVFGWLAIGSFFVFGGASAHAVAGLLHAMLVDINAQTIALAAVTGRVFGRQSFDVTAAMGVLLALDFLAAAIFVTAYTFLRGRRAAADRSL
jgi:anti-sigma factor RsiW